MAAAFGVHFGCSSSCIAVCKEDKTDVIANDAGDRVTPAVVAFTDVEQLVGLAAWQQFGRNPSNTICGVKKLLGKPFGHADVEATVLSSTVKIINNAEKPAYNVAYKEKQNSFSPVDVAAIIYKKMMETAGSHSGIADSHDAVMSVPLTFDEEQCTAIREAATKAGFNILRLISEPSAALLAYGIGQKDVTESCNVMVLRVGGLSTDMAVVAVSNGMYRILSSLGIPNVGGHQIDEILVEHFAAEFQKQCRMNCRNNPRSVIKLRVAVETCKHVLSTMNIAQCSIDSLYEGVDFNASLSRSRFEILCSSFIQSCIQPLNSCLNKAQLTKEDIDKVILCGGCCRIPILQQNVQEYFSTAECLQSIAPDEVIAVGCAVQAALLVGKDRNELEQFAADRELNCLSTEILIRFNNAESGTETVLQPYTPIPVRRQKTFTLSSGETTAVVDVLQRIPDSGQLASLAQLTLTDLTDGTSVNVVFHVRHDGSMHVTCTEPTSSKSQDVLIEAE